MTDITLEGIESRLRALNSIKDIVSSMKALSALSIRKAEAVLPNLRIYAENIEDAMAQMLHYFPEALRAISDTEGKSLIVVFCSEQGLCGLFNEKIITEAQNSINEHVEGIVVSGRKGVDEAKARGLPVMLGLGSPVSVDGVDISVMNLTRELFNFYQQGRFQQLYLLFAYHRRKGDYRIIRQRVLPPPLKRIAKKTRSKRPPLIYMKPEEIMENLLQQFISVSLYKAFVESLASENASRLLSMERASKAIEDRFSELSELYNYLRQEEITNKTIEIISGFEALRP
ncbi:MAG: hypothetical protein D6710_08420 [Nitrospirae bacterium]|nr:MAG: hypothetical protein D6710_08420 [Nitrospirota bacterium]